MEGWIKIYRKVVESEYYFAEPFNKIMAWFDLLIITNHKDGFFYKRGIRVEIQRGQSGYDIETLAKRWKWSRGKVERFLNDLEIDKQIERQKTNVTTIISICNYDQYQSDDNAKTSRTVKQTDTNKNDKKDNTNVLSLTWRNDFQVYLAECKQEFSKYYNDAEFIKRQQVFYPNVNIQRSIWKAYENYWGTEEGWANKKKSRTADINWKQTIVKALSFQTNKVYYTKEELAEK